jgi:lysophospholipase L1-like esterase
MAMPVGVGIGVPFGLSAAAFNPASLGTLLLSLKGNVNLYKDASQATPATAWADQIQQHRDEREAQGGSSFPYGNQASAGLRPTLAPQAFSNVGGVRFTNHRLQLTGLSGVDISNCTIAITGIFVTDYSQTFLTTAPAFLNVGTVAGGLSLLGFGTTANLALEPDINFSSADHSANLALPLSPYTVLTAQVSGGNATLNVNGTDAASITAPGSASVSNGYVGDWSNTNATCYGQWFGRVLIYSPALTTTNLAKLQTGLLAEALLNSLWPLTYPFLAYIGDSLTVGVGHGTITQSQTYPAQVLAGLNVSAGYLLAAVSGKTIDQIANAFTAGVNGHFNASRTGAQVVSYWAGTNDIAAGTSGATVYADFKTKSQVFKTQGFKLLAYTIMNNAQFTAGQITQQGIANTSWRSDFNVATAKPHIFGPAGGVTNADYLLDIQADPRLQTTGNTKYFSDGTHATVLGYQVIAGYNQDALALLGVTPAWTPAQDSSVVAWYDASTLVYKDNGTTLAGNGDTVQLWKDQTSNHRDLSQATGANRPQLVTAVLNGQSIIRFTRASPTWLATSAFTLNQPFCVILVGKFADNTQSYFFDGGSLNQDVMTNFPLDSAHVRIYAGTAGGGDFTTTPQSFHLYRAVFNGASSSLGIDAVPDTTVASTIGGNNLSALTVGAGADHTTSPLQGDIAAILLCNSVTPDERILNWLNNKYNLF